MPELPSRDLELEMFIRECFPEGKTDLTLIEGDAGLRNYFRVTGPGNNSGNNYILMDCPPSYCALEPFIRIADYFSAHNISAPRIIHQNTRDGFLLLEDFGDLSIKNHIKQQSGEETTKEIYYLIIDLLIFIQDLPVPSHLQVYDNELLLTELAGFANWYIPYKTGKKLAGEKLDNFMNLWQKILSKQIKMERTIVHRDYHAENMMYLPSRKGINSIGILDFQDAVVGSPIYDLVSVLEDARIDVPRNLALDCVGYYAQKKGLEAEDILLNYHILGAQRNTRILGIFARKAMRDNDSRYLKYIPLVLSYLKHDLSHPELSELKLLFADLL